MRHRFRRIVFWCGLALLVGAFLGALIVAYNQQAAAPLVADLRLPTPERAGPLRSFQIEFLTQQAREPAFDGQLFLSVDDAVLNGPYLTMVRDACGIYAKENQHLAVSRGGLFGTHVPPTKMSFPTNDRGHARFPFDSSHVDLTFRFDQPVPLDVVRITNRVPGFVLVTRTASAIRLPDGSLRIQVLLRRNFFTQALCALILVAGVTFAMLILATQTPAALGSSVAAFFFSLWSLRGVLASQIQTFPTLLDYAIVLLCCFMLIGLIWRIATHPELSNKPPNAPAYPGMQRTRFARR